ncbi:MAG: alpha-glucuronidase family glycosyl hydrolase [Mucilaginibacter sp.]
MIKIGSINKLRLLTFLLTALATLSSIKIFAENGYRLWLRYDPIQEPTKLKYYQSNCAGLVFYGNSQTDSAARSEMVLGLKGMLGKDVKEVRSITGNGTIVCGTPSGSPLVASFKLEKQLSKIGREGFIIVSKMIGNRTCTVIAANYDIGLLYGVFHFLELVQTQQKLENLNIQSSPKIQNRILNHWDNLNGTIERGYAGSSIWDWQRLPDYIDQRYVDYARANASVGINGAVLNNVNTSSLYLTSDVLSKVQALASVFRPYGIKVYLTARFTAPMDIGGLKTADPLDPAVIAWWKAKVEEIYNLIPDFGGFLIKANSEGQPGPNDYGRSHADGANMLADALAPHGGIVLWRAFVYKNSINEDRFKQAYKEFKPIDGAFRENAFLQVKNGPIDFQPREPFSPLFGAMSKTSMAMELEITQEYTGFSTYLVYLGTMYSETFLSDTYAHGKGSTVAKVIDGTLDNRSRTAISGVANIGSDINWCGHPFAQANWYAYGRLAWDPELSPEKIAEDWIKLTFSVDPKFVGPVKQMMMASRDNVVNSMMPLGLHHIMDASHYGPGPWINDKPKADGSLVNYHHADSIGIGFERTKAGSDALSQYFPEVEKRYSDLNTCPQELLLWFHHLAWNYKLKSGNTVWDELCYRYYDGVEQVRNMQKIWNSLENRIDKERFQQVKKLLKAQEKNAVRWRNSCVLYFQTYSKMPIPMNLEKPSGTLEYYKNLSYGMLSNKINLF